MLEATLREFRHACRSLAARPGFSSIVVLTLALGIGANAAIFSVVNAVLLQPLPYAQPDRLVRVWSAFPGEGLEHGTTSPLDLEDWRRTAVSFEAISGYPAITLSGLVMSGVDGPEELRAMHVTEGFFETFGVGAELGRTLGDEDQQESSNRVTVLSHATWRQRFGADAIVGAGTVTTIAEVLAVAKAGGQIIVTPYARGLVVEKAKELGLIAVPGALTPTEIAEMSACGADAVKIFPAEMGAPAIIKAMRAVLPATLPLLPVGGINPDNMAAYLEAGANGFGLGSALYRPGDSPVRVAANAAAFVQRMKELSPTKTMLLPTGPC